MVNTVGNIKLMYKIVWKYNRKYYVEVKSGFTEKEERYTEKRLFAIIVSYYPVIKTKLCSAN